MRRRALVPPVAADQPPKNPLGSTGPLADRVTSRHVKNRSRCPRRDLSKLRASLATHRNSRCNSLSYFRYLGPAASTQRSRERHFVLTVRQVTSKSFNFLEC